MTDKDHFQKYIDYINNASGGAGKVSIAYFDEDWEPLGPLVRRDLQAAGYTRQSENSIFLTEKVKNG